MAESPQLQLFGLPLRMREGHLESAVTITLGDDTVKNVTVRLDDEEQLAAIADELVTRYNGAAPSRDALLQQLRNLAQPADDDEPSRATASRATQIIELVTERAQLFHAPGEETYARIQVGAYHDTCAIASHRFRTWVAGEFYRATQNSASGQALNDALATLHAKARYDGPCRPVYLRTAPDGCGGFYLDLADEARRAVHVTPAGVTVVVNPAVDFVRPASMLPLPVPEFGGSLDPLQTYLNVRRDSDWILLKAWLRAAVRDRGPYGVLHLLGEHGTAKSTAERILRALIDPARPALRMEPCEREDLAIAARNNWLICYDNLSSIPSWLSDGLCCISTGTGFATRLLYTNFDEASLEAMRPIIITSIGDVVERGDLLDRIVLVRLRRIPDRRRRTEEDLWADFEQDRPQFLGALLEGVAKALAQLPQTRLDGLLRMADLTRFAVAAERGNKEPERFLEVYSGTRTSAHEQEIDGSVLGPALRALIQDHLPWQGTTGELLEKLAALAGERAVRSKYWPRSPQALGSELRRLAVALRHSDVVVTFPGEHKREVGTRRRLLTIEQGVLEDEETEEDKEDNLSPPLGRTDAPVSSAEGQAAGGVVPPAAKVGESLSSLSSLSSLDLSGGGVELPPVHLITTDEGLRQALPELRAAQRLLVDFETTGLDPRKDEARLLTLATAGAVYLIDLWRVNVQPLAEVFEHCPRLVMHNAAFDLSWFKSLGLPVPDGTRLFCTMLAAQLLGAGRKESYTLAAVVGRYVGGKLDKTQQTSDWGAGEITDAQKRYAALDGWILGDVEDRLVDELTRTSLMRTAQVERRALPAVGWLRQSGAPFDQDAWRALSDAAMTDVVEVERELNALAGESAVDWPSPKQVAKLLRARGHALPQTAKGNDSVNEAALAALAAEGEPLAALMLKYREATTRANTFGIDWLKWVHPVTGRIHADYWQIGTVTGRFSCNAPNLQCIPRDPRYRACFRPKDGRCLIKGDYAQSQVRIVAERSNEKSMIAAFVAGQEIYVDVAARLLGKDYSAISKDERQVSKALTLGLLFGMKAAGLQQEAAQKYKLFWSLDEAAEHRKHFFAQHPNLKAWHARCEAGSTTTRSLLGRRRLNVFKKNEKINSPIQADEADGLKTALALLYESRATCPDAQLVLCTHDEIVVECDIATAQRTAAWVEQCMVDGMRTVLRTVPVGVEITICRDWSGTPLEEEA